jgi:hypothetical protein
MVDTVRTRAEILALLADNISGDISPQDLRDSYVTANAEIDGKLSAIVAPRAVSSGNTTLISGDEFGRLIELTGTGNQDRTVEQDGTGGFTAAIGATAYVCNAAATGTKRLVAGSGVVFAPPVSPHTIANQDDVVTVVKRAANSWRVVGA